MTRHFIIVNKVMLVIQQRWSYLARLGLPAVFHKKNFLKAYKKSFTDQACSVKMAGYLPHCFFLSLWTSTRSRSINTQKKNSQPSWPHTWSITHTCTYSCTKIYSPPECSDSPSQDYSPPPSRITFPSTHLYTEVEIHTENKGSCPWTEHNDLYQDSNLDYMICTPACW